MDLIYWIVYFVFYIILGIIIGLICSKVADSKGYNGKTFFWAGFFFLFAGLLIVIAYKDLKSEQQNSTIISSLYEIKKLLNNQYNEITKIKSNFKLKGPKLNTSKSSTEKEKADINQENLIYQKVWNRVEKKHGYIKKILDNTEIQVQNKYGIFNWKIEDCDLK